MCIRDRVTSDRLFGVDTKSGDIRWEYNGGAIINSTITIGKDDVISLLRVLQPWRLRRLELFRTLAS